VKMASGLSSRERLLRSIDHQEPDHVPLYIKWWERQFPETESQRWKDQYQRVEWNLQHGLDQGMELLPPKWRLNPRLRTHVWKETRPGEKYPILVKEYELPAGTLRQEVRQTRGWSGRSRYNYFDWSYGDDVPLEGNELINRSLRFLVETEEDSEVFKQLFVPPTEEQVEVFYEDAEKAKKFAQEREALLETGFGFLEGASALLHWLGEKNMMIAEYRSPKVVKNLIEVNHRFEMEALDRVIKVGDIDMVMHAGWYDNGEFYPPPKFREFIAPTIRDEVDLCHKHGVKYCFIATIGVMPIISILKELGVDLLFGVDPIQGNTDLRRVKEQIGDRVCLWGGVSGAVTLGFGPRERIQQETRDAIRTLGPGGGFILAPIDQLWPYTPWENIQTMIETWRREGNYPLEVS